MAIDRSKLDQMRFDDLVAADEERDRPISPGEILREEFLEPLGLSAAALARALHVPPNRIASGTIFWNDTGILDSSASRVRTS